MATTGIEWGGRGIEWGGRGQHLRGQHLRGQHLRGQHLRGQHLRDVEHHLGRRAEVVTRPQLTRSDRAVRFRQGTHGQVSMTAEQHVDRQLATHGRALPLRPQRHPGGVRGGSSGASTSSISIASPTSRSRFPLWVLAAAFAITELVSVHLESRGEAHAVTFSEIPFVADLFFVDPATLVVARLLAGVLVLGIIRRQSLHKLAFNLAWFTLEAAIATTIFRLALGDADPLTFRAWPAALAGMLAAHIVATVTVTSAITLFSGWPGRDLVRRVFIFGGIACIANTSTGLAIAVSMWERSYFGSPAGGLGRRAVRRLPRLHRTDRAPQEPRDAARVHSCARWLGRAA